VGTIPGGGTPATAHEARRPPGSVASRIAAVSFPDPPKAPGRQQPTRQQQPARPPRRQPRPPPAKGPTR
jgi:hypothetical protein